MRNLLFLLGTFMLIVAFSSFETSSESVVKPTAPETREYKKISFDDLYRSQKFSQFYTK